MSDIEKYADILSLPHHVSPTRRRMSMAERAAQFSPFAALAGYGEAIQETGRVVERQAELSEDEKAVLDRTQQDILGMLKQGGCPAVKIIYFQPDRKKDGGKYVMVYGVVKRVDEVQRHIVLSDDRAVPFDALWEVEIVS